MAEKIVTRSGSYTANTVTTLYENSGETALVTHEMSVYNGDSSDNTVQIYTTTSGGVIQEWLLNGNVGAGEIISNTDKIWLPAGYLIKFKTNWSNAVIVAANLYG